MVIGVDKLGVIILGFNLGRQCLFLAGRAVDFLLHQLQVVLRTGHLYFAGIVRIGHLLRALLRPVKRLRLLLFLPSFPLDLCKVVAVVVGAFYGVLRQSLRLHLPQVEVEAVHAALEGVEVLGVEHFVAVEE